MPVSSEHHRHPAQIPPRGFDVQTECRAENWAPHGSGFARLSWFADEQRRWFMSRLSGLRVAVLATDGFEESELTDPVAVLRQSGATVDIISLESQPIQGFKHLQKATTVKVDRTINDA